MNQPGQYSQPDKPMTCVECSKRTARGYLYESPDGPKGLCSPKCEKKYNEG